MTDPRSAPDPQDREPRIAIIGAGPAGLSVGWFLKLMGYRDVTIFEKLARVGGQCKSITDGYMSFDMGGTYVTPAYTETLQIARAVGAERYRGKEYKAIRVERGAGDGKGFVAGEVHEYVRYGLDQIQQSGIGLWQLLRGGLRFALERFRVRHIVDSPSFAGLRGNKELCVSFEQWLKDKKIDFLKPMFEIPVTMMGYGYLHEVAAPYVLKYMAGGTYWSMIVRGIPIVRKFYGWPHRFEEGFQRTWDRVAAGLNVRSDVVIRRISRSTDRPLPIGIHLAYADHLHAQTSETQTDTLFFDKVVIACPLTLDVLGSFFRKSKYDRNEPAITRNDRQLVSLTDTEWRLFSAIEPFTYVQNTLHAVTIDKDGSERPFRLMAPVVPVLPFEPATEGKPWIIVQVWGEESRLLQFYTRVPDNGASPATTKKQVTEASKRLLKLLGAAEAGSSYTFLRKWKTYDCWPYFGHVSPQEIERGFFDELEGIQGANDTYYTGGAATFEMVEAIVCHAKHIAHKLGDDLEAQAFPHPRRPWIGDTWSRRMRREAL